MRDRLLFPALAALLFLPGLRPAPAAADSLFLKMDGVNGEATSANHQNQIVLSSFSQQWEQAPNSAGAIGLRPGLGAGRANIGPIKVTKQLDLSSTALMLRCASGQVARQARLAACRIRKSTIEEYLVCTLTDACVTSYHITSASDGGVPTEEVELSFSSIQWEYYPTRPDGTLGTPVKCGWDLRQNQAKGADEPVARSVESPK